MKRMRTFLMYALLIIGFIFLSYVLEDGLLENMFEPLSVQTNNGSYSNISIEDLNGKASNVNGYINFKLRNNSSSTLNCYAMIDLYSKQNLNAVTKYIDVPDLKPAEERNFQVKFRANEITSYKISLVSEKPDKSNIINILGWEIDATNVFGMDLSETTLFGVKLTELFSWDGAKTAAGNALDWFIVLTNSVPWWGYAIGAGIILWYMPKGYLFGIFPF